MCELKEENDEKRQYVLKELNSLENAETKFGLNFRRTYFFFIDFITILFQKQGVPHQTTLKDLKAYDLS